MATATSTLTKYSASPYAGVPAPSRAPRAAGAAGVPRAPRAARAAGVPRAPRAVAGEAMAPRTAAGERAAQRRRARVSADRRPPSGMLPSTNRTAAVVSADRGDQVAYRPFRMGRWARLMSTVSVAAAALALGVALLSGSGRQVMGEVTVAPGDSLWSIAQQSDPGADPRAVVDQIRQLNGLSGDAISVGAVLQVPTAAR
ncbi:hypothetical protein ABIB25_004020 [Nakamurella sp. UYEF19]|uniref:LysM peptidoglycan-binding domain-containing protein n=1 Tax=Nakamurella sp. UYEF19 TaxID=1756392 RepID=UPI003394A067